MKKIDDYTRARYLLMYGLNKITMDEMLNYFRNHYGFEGNFQELMEELVDESIEELK